MTRYLAIHVRAHEGRYHGDGDDPPSPFRLFQALVAGAGISGPLDGMTKQALTWLEGLSDAPIIASPRTVRGQSVSMFMPNNDLDAKGGDVRRIGEIRLATKVWRPRIFDAKVPWIYAWPFADNDEANAATISRLSERIYQLGRGIDMAWAWTELLDEDALEVRLAEYDGVVRRPSAGDGLLLACPCADSLKSLERRYQARRFRYEGDQRVFLQPPKPSYRQLAYESPPTRHVFEFRSTLDLERRVAWPLVEASSLVVSAREAARTRLSTAMPDRTNEIDRHLVGRKSDGTNAVSSEGRVRIIPIPSIGMHYADRVIRRLLVEVPAACPLYSEDVRWAFSSAELFDPETGEMKDVLLSPSADDNMLDHYGVDGGARVFRSVTPVALPEGVKRRRIEPMRKIAEAKRGLERVLEIAGGRAAVVQALRHAGIHTPVNSIRLQREPFDAAGSRVEGFAEGTRFAKERLWHVEITFDRPVAGPLVIGDGRFLGLGLMAPINSVPEWHVFTIEDGLEKGASPWQVTQALRRAVMARVQIVIGERKELPVFFSGHERDGEPLRRETKRHLAFASDFSRGHIWVIAPHLLEGRQPTNKERENLKILDSAVSGLQDLRAGAAGRLRLSRHMVSPDSDPLLKPSRIWESVTDYEPTRHGKRVAPEEVIAQDIRTEILRRKMALPEEIEVLRVQEGPKGGLRAKVRLKFAAAVCGPVLLGRSCHVGGGFFTAVDR